VLRRLLSQPPECRTSSARSVTGSYHPVLKKIDAVPIFFWVVGFWRGILLAIFFYLQKVFEKKPPSGGLGGFTTFLNQSVPKEKIQSSRAN